VGGPYFLASQRIGFRTWAAVDFPLALALWGDPEVTALFDARGRLSEDQVRERLLREIATQLGHGVQYWPVFLLETGDHLGRAGLRPYKIDGGVYEIGVHLRPAFWRRGHATEAAWAVIAYGFRRLGARALFAGHNPRNERSRGLVARLGFRYTHDELYPPTGLLHPSYLLTAEEFAAQPRRH